MNREDIIKLAGAVLERPGEFPAYRGGLWHVTTEELVRLVSDAAAAEREECAKVCEGMYTNGDGAEGWLAHAATYIRARGQS